jgi:hypothetical protein
MTLGIKVLYECGETNHIQTTAPLIPFFLLAVLWGIPYVVLDICNVIPLTSG